MRVSVLSAYNKAPIYQGVHVAKSHNSQEITVADQAASPEYSGTRLEASDGGVTLRTVALSLALAGLFGYIIPLIDVRFANTFLGAAHLPPGAVAVLLAVVLLINPLAGLAARN